MGWGGVGYPGGVDAPSAWTIAQHTLRTLGQLPLPPEQRVAVLGQLYRAAGRAPPPAERLHRWLSCTDTSDASALADVSAVEQEALCAALCAPDLGAALAGALGQVAPPPPPPSSLPSYPHPLGPEARFPPRIARLVGLEGHTLSGTPRPLPCLPFSVSVLDFRAALRLDPPPRRAVLIGGGYIGVELALGWATTASCAVTLLDGQPSLMRGYIPHHAAEALALLQAAGVEVCLGVQVTGGRPSAQGMAVVEGWWAGHLRQWLAERVVVAVGLHPSR